MKRLITLIFIFTLVSSMAFAQNEATVEQIGTSGGQNQATIDQLYEEAFGVSGVNVADVFQTGDHNLVEELIQWGSGNEYTVYQDGSYNTVKRFPEQGKVEKSANGLIDIDQFGVENTVWDADQSGENNTNIIYQEGIGNFADVEGQRSGGPAGNDINIYQDGDYHKVGTGTGTGAYQEGVGNDMDIDQTGEYNAAGTESVQGISSEWSGVPNQEGGQGLVQLGSDNEMTILQTGDNNTVKFVLQDGIQNMTDIMQNNSGNFTDVTQKGFGNETTVTQN